MKPGGWAAWGLVRSRSGDPYKPSALRSYEEALRTKVLPELGRLGLSALTRNSVQDLADRLSAQGLAPSTVRNAVLPLRPIYRRAIQRTEVLGNPTEGLALPAVRGRRERVVRPAEARRLIEALPETDRALWATALYAGLRPGELQGLRWPDVDFEASVRVERSWDQREGPVAPKSRAGSTSRPSTATPSRSRSTSTWSRAIRPRVASRTRPCAPSWRFSPRSGPSARPPTLCAAAMSTLRVGQTLKSFAAEAAPAWRDWHSSHHSRWPSRAYATPLWRAAALEGRERSEALTTYRPAGGFRRPRRNSAA